MNNIIISRVTGLSKIKNESPTASMKNAGVGKDFFIQLRRGQIPNVERIRKLAEYFDVSVDYLLGRTDNPAPPGRDRPKLDDESLKFALFDDVDVTDDVLDEIKRFAQFALLSKERRLERRTI